TRPIDRAPSPPDGNDEPWELGGCFETLRRGTSFCVISETQAFALGMRRPLRPATLRLHAAIQREVCTRTADFARTGWSSGEVLLRHSQWRADRAGWLHDGGRSGDSCR